MLEDPYIMFAKCFATWLRIRFLLAFMIIWSIILMSLSAWEMQYSGGNFANIKFPSGRQYSDLGSSICTQMPYKYLSPFDFTFSSNTTSSSSTDTYCPWPTANSELRITMTVFSIVTLGLLFVKTPLSFFARAIFAVYAFIFFSAFVIDAVAVTVGLDFCTTSFADTLLNVDLRSMNINVNCKASNYQIIPVFDLVLSCIYFLTYTAWNFATDLYVERGGSTSGGDKKPLFGRK